MFIPAQTYDMASDLRASPLPVALGRMVDGGHKSHSICLPTPDGGNPYGCRDQLTRPKIAHRQEIGLALGYVCRRRNWIQP